MPVLATWLSLDMFAEDDPLYVGKPGSVAPRGVNFALQNADFLLILGARLDVSITGYAPDRLAREARKVMVDIDRAEIAKLAPFLDVQVETDAGDFLRALRGALPRLQKPDWSAWIDRCRDWKAKYPVVLPEHRIPDQKVSVYNLAEALGGQLPEGQVIVSGS